VPTRLLLEGPDITELLARIRREHGEGARILKAEKLRVGGFAGFFAKQRYEVVLEVEDLVPAPAPVAAAASVAVTAPVAVTASAAPAAPASLEELADLADRADIAELAEAARPAQVTQPAEVQGPAQVTRPAEVPGPADTTASVTGRELVGSRAPGRAVSTESDEFASVLSRLTDGLGTGIDFDSLPPAPIEPPAEFRPLYGTMPAAPAERVEPAPATVPEARVGAPAPAAGAPIVPLRALGVPGHLAAAVDPADIHAGLVKVFGTLPAAPALPKRPGDVLVVVGDAAAAVPVGRVLAKKMRLDPTKILLAAASTAGTGVHGTRRVTGAADGERRARRMHRADVAHVVVVDAPQDADSAEWAKEIADAVGATQVWAVVDATRKVGDVADHLERLGGVDALVVHGADVTRDPASVLDLDVPVAMLDGRPATARAWADLLAGRLDRQPDAARTSGRRAGRS
jgi:hypothetical protein